MRSRHLLIGIGTLTLVAAAAFTLLGSPTEAYELTPSIAPAPSEMPAHGDAPEPEAAVAEGGAVHKSDVVIADPTYNPRRGPDTAGWTSGMIVGDIPLSPSVLGQIQSISVVVDELRNVRAGDPARYRKVVNVPMTPGTPTFEVRDVPFSKYGYLVSVRSPGFNGGQATVAIDEEHPYVDDVKLPITPGSPFSLRLRDQESRPVKFLEVRLVPTGEPLGRSRYDGQADNYGSVVFESILAGDYQVFVGPPGQPIAAPQIVTVQPGAWLVRGGVVQPQGQSITVPIGQPVEVAVTDVSGYPMLETRVLLRATDRPKRTEFVETTDVHGRVRWPNVLTGMWEIEVTKPDHQITQRQLQVKDGEAPPLIEIQLMRLR